MPGETEHDDLIMTLVESALGRPLQERSHYLRAVCRSPEMFDEVLRRVEWDERMGDFLCEPLIERQVAGRPFEPGTRLADRFQVIREVGAGGMGVVYEAIDEKLDRRVAIKCAKIGYSYRLPPEARAAREVSHFNVCKVHDLHVAQTPQGDVEFLSMEFIEGETLTDRMHREPPLNSSEVREIARQVCSGLAQAHRQGVIHGDIKGGNIILTRTREGGTRAVLTDFGLARLGPEESGGFVSERGGTLDYMAPELLLGQGADVASDIYALGVLFHRMLTGQTPARLSPPPIPEPPRLERDGSRVSTVTLVHPEVGAGWERQIDDLPSPWDRIVKRCLAPRPQDRYPSVDQVLDVFEPRRSALKWMIAAMFVVMVALVLGLWSARRETPAGPPVRLAVVPVPVDGEVIKSAAGIANDVADRLTGLRKNFIVIPPNEALRNPVKDLQEAKSILGATHVLELRLRRTNVGISAEASIMDTASGQTLRDLRGNYAANDTSTLEKALLATVTGAFHLRAAPPESISAVAHPFYIQGIALIRRDSESADEAIPLLNKAIELDPNSALPYAGLAQAQAQKFQKGAGRQWLDMAAASVAKGKSINADSAQVLLASGFVQEEQGRYEPAIRDFSRVTELDPSNMEAWRLLASAYESSNRPEDAVATYRKAIQVAPNYYRLHIDFGTFYYLRSQFQEAEASYRRSVAISPSLSEGHMGLGLALMGQGRLPEAEDSMLTSLRLRETSRGFVNLGFLYYMQERFQEAARMFERSLAGQSRSAIWYWDLGAAYQHLGRDQDAITAFRAGKSIAAEDVAHNPRRANSRALLALLSAYLGDSNSAIFEITQALGMEPDNVLVKRYAVFTYELLHERERTLEVLRDAPAHLLEELNRQPDLKDLRHAPEFLELIQKKSTN